MACSSGVWLWRPPLPVRYHGSSVYRYSASRYLTSRAARRRAVLVAMSVPRVGDDEPVDVNALGAGVELDLEALAAVRLFERVGTVGVAGAALDHHVRVRLVHHHLLQTVTRLT